MSPSDATQAIKCYERADGWTNHIFTRGSVVCECGYSRAENGFPAASKPRETMGTSGNVIVLSQDGMDALKKSADSSALPSAEARETLQHHVAQALLSVGTDGRLPPDFWTRYDDLIAAVQRSADAHGSTEKMLARAQLAATTFARTPHPGAAERDPDLIADAQRQQDWQPIETVPKDGRRILVFCPDECGSYTRQIAHIDEDDAGEFWQYEAQSVAYSRAHPPTHGQPLPAPPLAAEDSRGDDR